GAASAVERIVGALRGSEAHRLPQFLALLRAPVPARYRRFHRAQARRCAESSPSRAADLHRAQVAGARYRARTLRARGRLAARGAKARRPNGAARDIGRQRARHKELPRVVRPQCCDARRGVGDAGAKSAMSDALSLLLVPFAASIAFVLIHAYFGVHVLRRNIVFADLALAQLSALGATVAFASGYAPASAAGFAYGLLFTAIGAALLTLTRRLAHVVSQEAFVGILYVVATAA